MADSVVAQDGYKEYYTEKLWSLIPAVYRSADATGDWPGTLRGIVEVIAEQAAILRRDQDRVWDDSFIDLCDDWAVPYIGDLVGTRMISALDKRGRRVDVAKTIYYRRRKGTPRVLEELIGDITSWDGTVVEAFRRLARTRHALDPKPGPLAGRFSGTPPGGLADLRRPFTSTLTDGPFDEYAHIADVRKQRDHSGLWNIPKLLFFMFRLQSFAVTAAAPAASTAAGTFLFDPSGRDIKLFARHRAVPDWDAWRFPLPWELHGPIACRLLGDAEYMVTQALILSLGQVLSAAGQLPAAANDLAALRDLRFPSEAAFLARITSLPSQTALLQPAVYHAILDGALVADCGKMALLPASIEVDVAGIATPVALTTAGNLADWAAAPTGKSLVIDPERGRFKFTAGAPAGAVTVTYHYGFSGPVGAGPDDRRAGLADVTTLPAFVRKHGGGALAAADVPASGGLSIDDSLSYGPAASAGGLRQVVIQADNLQRPYLRLAAPWVLTATADQDNTLVLDGLWIGGSAGARLELAGTWQQVTLRRVTLDPGGIDADGNPIAAIPLVVSGKVANLTIEGCILAPISTSGAGIIDAMSLSDSVVQAGGPGQAAITLAPGPVDLQRVTVLGDLVLERLYASEVLLLGTGTIADTQWGCFRFSAAYTGSRLPHPFQTTELAAGTRILTSTKFGDPEFCQISDAAPATIRRGAEDGSEIGAFSSLNAPAQLDGLTAKVEEYMPFGLIPAFIFQT
jgi:hypothetical protein